MTFSRRQLLLWSTAVAAAQALPCFAQTQSYPSRAVRFIVGYAPGGATDITARLIAQWLSTYFGQQFIVENRPGAATNIAAADVARTAADGHTLFVSSAANAINASLYGKLNFDFVRDFDAVAGLVQMQNVLEVHPSVPARNVAELIAYAKANPDKLSFGSPGIGSPGHVSGELFKMMTGIKMLHVPYRGVAPALADLLSGQIQVMIDNMATAIEHIRTGAVRGLAVTTATRSKLLPDLPTISEFVPNYDASSWFGLSAPKDTPPHVIATLNKAIGTALADPAIVLQFEKLGGTPLLRTPAEFQKFVIAETEKWAKVVRFAGLKAE